MKYTAGSSLNVMPLPPAADAAKLFQEYLDATSLAPNTVLAYSSSVRQFFRLYKEITPDTLHLYKAYLMEHYRPQTVNLRIRAVNSYIECFHLPVSRLPAIRIQQKLYAEHVISEADYEYLKSRFIQDEKYVYYFIVRYMAATGVRVGELLKIQAEDVAKGYKDLISKGGKKPEDLYSKKASGGYFSVAGCPWDQERSVLSQSERSSHHCRRHTVPAETRRSYLRAGSCGGLSPFLPPPFRQKFSGTF